MLGKRVNLAKAKVTSKVIRIFCRRKSESVLFRFWSGGMKTELL